MNDSKPRYFCLGCCEPLESGWWHSGCYAVVRGAMFPHESKKRADAARRRVVGPDDEEEDE